MRIIYHDGIGAVCAIVDDVINLLTDDDGETYAYFEVDGKDFKINVRNVSMIG